MNLTPTFSPLGHFPGVVQRPPQPRHMNPTLASFIQPSAFPAPITGPGGLDLACVAMPVSPLFLPWFFRQGGHESDLGEASVKPDQGLALPAFGALLLDDDLTFMMGGTPIFHARGPETAILDLMRWTLMTQPSSWAPSPICMFPKGSSGIFALRDGMEWVQAYQLPNPPKVAQTLSTLGFGPLEITHQGLIRHHASHAEYDVMCIPSTGHVMAYSSYGAFDAIPIEPSCEGALAPHDPNAACTLAIARHLDRHSPLIPGISWQIPHPEYPGTGISLTLTHLVDEADEDATTCTIELSLITRPDPGGPVTLTPWTAFKAVLPITPSSSPEAHLEALTDALLTSPEDLLNHFLFAGPGERFRLSDCTAQAVSRWHTVANLFTNVRDTLVLVAEDRKQISA